MNLGAWPWPCPMGGNRRERRGSAHHSSRHGPRTILCDATSTIVYLQTRLRRAPRRAPRVDENQVFASRTTFVACRPRSSRRRSGFRGRLAGPQIRPSARWDYGWRSASPAQGRSVPDSCRHSSQGAPASRRAGAQHRGRGDLTPSRLAPAGELALASAHSRGVARSWAA